MIRTPLALCALLLSTSLSAQVVGTASDWQTNGVCYEVFVRSFYDSDGDGVGDLPGLIEKLDYINDGDATTRDDLGANCIWLMPVAQSPSYHGYDVTNYYEVNRDYGTNEDFKRLMAEAHRRGVRVLVDLVLNHTSSEHPHFRSALLDPDSPYRDWFHLSTTKPEGLGPWGQEVWHRSPLGDDHYLGIFWGGMPDLNLGEPAVQAEVEKITRFWLEEMDVDGFRIDAVKHFFETAEGGHAKNHPWLREFTRTIRGISPDVFTVGEVWDSTGAIAAYYPDQLDAYFVFEVADGVIEAARTGKKSRFVAAVERAQRDLPAGRWSPFLRNHDQTRTMTELQGDVRRAKTAATLLLTLPGLPFVYYGEEIGMTAAKPDPRLRTPMHWSQTPGVGFSRTTPWEPLQPDSFTANVAAQDADPRSLLSHYRQLIHLRGENPALGADAAFVPLDTGDEALVAYIRRTGDQTALVLVNLGDRKLSRVKLSSAEAVLPRGRYATRALFGGESSATLSVPADGRIRGWSPTKAIGAFESRIIELSPAR